MHLPTSQLSITNGCTRLEQSKVPPEEGMRKQITGEKKNRSPSASLGLQGRSAADDYEVEARVVSLGAQVQAPVVAGHEVPLRELKLARLEQLEAEPAADRVRRRVVDVREGVHEAVLVVALGELDRVRGRRHRDAAALELRHDHPADLVDPLVAPLLRPEADRADAGAARRVDDLEHAIAALEALVAALTLAQLVRALGAAEVLGHARVAHQPLEQRQVAAAPGREGNRRAHSAQPSKPSLFTEDGSWRISYFNAELESREAIRAGIERMEGL